MNNPKKSRKMKNIKMSDSKNPNMLMNTNRKQNRNKKYKSKNRNLYSSMKLLKNEKLNRETRNKYDG